MPVQQKIAYFEKISSQQNASAQWASQVHDAAVKFQKMSGKESGQVTKPCQLGKKSMRNLKVVTHGNDQWNVDAIAFTGPNAIRDASEHVRTLQDTKYWQRHWGVMSTTIKREWHEDAKIVFLTINSRALNRDMEPYISLYVISNAYVDPYDQLLSGAKFCGSTSMIVRYTEDKIYEVLEREILAQLYPLWIRVSPRPSLEQRPLLGQQRVKSH